MSTAIAANKPGPSALGKFLGQENVKRQLQMAMPKHMTADRIVRATLTAALKNPKLYQADTNSLALALLDASQLGLEPNGRDAHLVPFKNSKKSKAAGHDVFDVQLIPDYKGLVQLAYQSGIVRGIDAKAVHEKDLFQYELGSNDFVKHIPCTEDDPGQLVYAWAMVKFKDGGEKFVVLNRRDIKKRRDKSQTANSDYANVREQSPWNTHPESMWAKSAIKELSKWMPQKQGLEIFQKAVEIDTSSDMGTPIIDAYSSLQDDSLPDTEKPTKAEELAGKLRDAKQMQQPSEQPALSEDEAIELTQWREHLAELTDITAVNNAKNSIPPTFSPLLKEKIQEECEKRLLAIRGNRGEKTNGLFNKQQSATEKGA